MKRLVMAVGLVLVLMLFANVASASYILDFGVVPYSPPVVNPGSISYGAANGPLVGGGIAVKDVTALGMPVNNGVYAVSSGVLSFGTGNLMSYNSLGGGVEVWIFGGGPSSYIQITGGVPAAGILNTNTQLMWGRFGTATVTGFGGEFKTTVSAYTDEKNADLAAYFGIGQLANHVWEGNMNLSFNALANPDHTFTSNRILSGDVPNTIPEPASLLLLGSGLVGLAGYVRRRRSA